MYKFNDELDEQISLEDEDPEEWGLEEEETLEELDVDDRGHVHPRRRYADADEPENDE